MFVSGHCAVYEPASSYECLCYNAMEMMDVFHQYSECIVGYLAGHDHTGGDAVDEKGILHLTLPGVLENDEDSDFGTVYVYADRMEIAGNGRVPDLVVPLRYQLDAQKHIMYANEGEASERNVEISCSSGL